MILEIQQSSVPTFNNSLQNAPHTQTHTHSKHQKNIRKQHANQHTYIPHTHTCLKGQKWRYCTTVQVTSTCKHLSVFLLYHQFHKHNTFIFEKIIIFLLWLFFLSNKTVLKSKWNSSISVTWASINKYSQAMVWLESMCACMCMMEIHCGWKCNACSTACNACKLCCVRGES